MNTDPSFGQSVELRAGDASIVASVEVTLYGVPTEPGTLTVLHQDYLESRTMVPGEPPIIQKYSFGSLEPSQLLFSATWMAKGVSPEQKVAAVRQFYADLAGKVSPNHESYYIFWDVEANDEVEFGPIPLQEILERYLNPYSVQSMFRISAGVDVWGTGTLGNQVCPNSVGLIANNSLPLELVLRFYASTSGIDRPTPPKGLDTLEEVMSNFKPL